MTSRRLHDLWTIMAIGMVVYLIKNVVHEGLGHGGVCILVGGEPLGISSAWWDGNYDGVSAWGRRFAKGGGTVANLVLGFGLLPFWPRLQKLPASLAYFFWLTIVVNLLSGGGYMMVDPIFMFGDWAGFLNGLEPAVPLRMLIVAIGIAISLFGMFWGRRTIGLFLEPDPAARKTSIRVLCWAPYFVGSTVFVASATLNPGGPKFILTVAAATFGGTAWLPWFLGFMVKPSDNEAVHAVPASTWWRVAGVTAAIVTIAVLGPSIRFD